MAKAITFDFTRASGEELREMVVLVRASRIAAVGVTPDRKRSAWDYLDDLVQQVEDELRRRNAWVPGSDMAERIYGRLPTMHD